MPKDCLKILADHPLFSPKQTQARDFVNRAERTQTPLWQECSGLVGRAAESVGRRFDHAI
jgi:hypothetical protein